MRCGVGGRAVTFRKQTAGGWGRAGRPGGRRAGTCPGAGWGPRRQHPKGSGRLRRGPRKARSVVSRRPGASPAGRSSARWCVQQPGRGSSHLALGLGLGPVGREERAQSLAAWLEGVAGCAPQGPQVHSDLRPFLWSREARPGRRCEVTPSKLAPVHLSRLDCAWPVSWLLSGAAGVSRASPPELRSVYAPGAPWRPALPGRPPSLPHQPLPRVCLSSVLRAPGPQGHLPGRCPPSIP